MPRIRILKDSPLYRLRESLDIIRIGPSEEGDIVEATFQARDLASEWHSGQSSVLYGFSSTGDLEYWGPKLRNLPTARYQRGRHSISGGRNIMPGNEREAMEILREYARAMAQAGLCGPFLRVISTRFTIEDDGHGGSEQVWSSVDSQGYPEPYSDEWISCTPDQWDREEGLTVADLAVKVCQENGATEDSGSWFSDPGGSQIVDYGTGEREEVSAHPYGFTPEQEEAVSDLLKATRGY